MFILIPGIIAWCYTGALWNSYATLPRTPDSAAGRVYPIGVHGLTVYQTLAQRDRLNLLLRTSAIVFSLGFALAVIEEEKWKRSHPKMGPPKDWKP